MKRLANGVGGMNGALAKGRFIGRFDCFKYSAIYKNTADQEGILLTPIFSLDMVFLPTH